MGTYGSVPVVAALLYVADGRSGANRDYVVSTVKELEALGFRDASLHLIAERLKGAHETPPAP